PTARLGVCKTLRDHGLACNVLMAPVLPFLSDSDEQLEQAVAAIARAGATSVTPLPLHLRTGAREWYFRWLAQQHPTLIPRYERLYARGAYASRGYSEQLHRRVDRLARRYGIPGRSPENEAESARTGAASTEATSTCAASGSNNGRVTSFRTIKVGEERHAYQQQLALL
ncbi:MAG: hypothetical protein ACRDPW_00940, partial [Mycobacteriales bacterium]